MVWDALVGLAFSSTRTTLRLPLGWAVEDLRSRVPAFRHSVQPKGRRPVTLTEPSWHQLRPRKLSTLLDILYLEVESRDPVIDEEIH